MQAVSVLNGLVEFGVLYKEFVIKSICGVNTLFWVLLEKSFHQVQPFRRNLLVHVLCEVDLASSILGQDFIVF